VTAFYTTNFGVLEYWSTGVVEEKRRQKAEDRRQISDSVLCPLSSVL
jgi:hypothetical protein